MIEYIPFLKSFLHFVTSGVVAVVSYKLFLIWFKNKIGTNKTAISFALFFSILLHVFVDYYLWWF